MLLLKYYFQMKNGDMCIDTIKEYSMYIQQILFYAYFKILVIHDFIYRMRL